MPKKTKKTQRPKKEVNGRLDTVASCDSVATVRSQQ